MWFYVVQRLVVRSLQTESLAFERCSVTSAPLYKWFQALLASGKNANIDFIGLLWAWSMLKKVQFVEVHGEGTPEALLTYLLL